MDPNDDIAVETQVLCFRKCTTEDDLDRICEDITDCDGTITHRSMNEDEGIGFVHVTTLKDQYNNFWEMFKQTESSELVV